MTMINIHNSNDATGDDNDDAGDTNVYIDKDNYDKK